MPEVSVIIPTYNRAEMVTRAIDSVLAQTYPDWELVVVDDGSRDNTREVIARYASLPVRYIYQQNAGTPAARNTGVRASTGRYIAFLDSDDLFLPDKLRLQVDALEHQPELGLVASGWVEVDAAGTPGRQYRPWLFHPDLSLAGWLYDCPVIVPATLIRREWLERVGMFDASLPYVEDWDLWLRLAYAGCPMAWMPGLVCHRTVHADSKIRRIAEMQTGLLQMLDRFFARPDLPDEVRDQQNNVYARAYLDGTVRALGAGRTADGEKWLAEAVRLNPSLLTGNPPAALQSLASAALTHLAPDRDGYIKAVCRAVSAVSPVLACSPRQFRAMIQAASAFEALVGGQRRRARFQAARTLLTDPAWVRSRGLLSVLLKP